MPNKFEKLIERIPGEHPALETFDNWPNPLYHVDATLTPGVNGGVAVYHGPAPQQARGRHAIMGPIKLSEVSYEPRGYEQAHVNLPNRTGSGWAPFEISQATVRNLKNGGKLYHRTHPHLPNHHIDTTGPSRPQDGIYEVSRVTEDVIDTRVVLNGIAAALGLEGPDAQLFTNVLMNPFGR